MANEAKKQNDAELNAASSLKQERTDEYYWLEGDFWLGKGTVKIQRDSSKQKVGYFKEAIVLSLEKIHTSFHKRYTGIDIDSKMGSLLLRTYSCFGKKSRTSSTIISGNLQVNDKKITEELVNLNIRILPPNTDMYFEMTASANSLRIYYLPLIMNRLMMFLGQRETITSTYNALNDIKDSTQDSIQAALEGKKYKITVAIKSPVIIVPILKNNDSSSPVWRFRLGDIGLFSKVIFNQF